MNDEDELPTVGPVRNQPPQKISTLNHETDITWLQPTCTLPRYVRETTIITARRRGQPPKKHMAGIVGYANLAADARSSGGCFHRRIFWLASHDPYPYRGAPCEAVDPYTVSPGVPGQLTPRALGDANRAADVILTAAREA